MKIAELPNGVEIHFPDDVSDAEMDATVQRYLSNAGSTEGIGKINETLAEVVDALKGVSKENKEQQETMVKAVEAIAATILESADKLNSEELVKSINTMAKTNFEAFAAVARHIRTLQETMSQPIAFKYSADGKLIEAN